MDGEGVASTYKDGVRLIALWPDVQSTRTVLVNMTNVSLEIHNCESLHLDLMGNMYEEE